MISKEYRARGTKNTREEQRREKAMKGQLFRLLTAAFLFLVCLIGKTQFPAETEQYRLQMARMIRTDTDFQSAFAELGEELSGGNALGAVGEWCVEVFAPGIPADAQTLKEYGEQLQEENVRFLTSWNGDGEALRAYLMRGG